MDLKQNIDDQGESFILTWIDTSPGCVTGPGPLGAPGVLVPKRADGGPKTETGT